VERHSVRKPCPRRSHTAAIPLADLTAVGVTTVAIPRTGKLSAARARIEPADDFVDTVKCRTGCEGRVSHLERDWAWRRTRLRGHAGARTWCAHGVFAARVATLTIRGLGVSLAVRPAEHSSIAATHRWDDADDQAATIGVGDQIAPFWPRVVHPVVHPSDGTR
jgi:hypothetical protein